MTKIFLTLITILGFQAQAEVKVSVRHEAQIALGNVTLGAVADILSTNLADEKQLGALILGESPRPGHTVTWTSTEIEKRLRPYQRILQGAQIKFPDRLTIRRVVKTFTREDLKKLIEGAIQTALPDSSWEAKLTDVNLPQELQIPHDGSVQAVPPTSRPRGTGSFEVQIVKDGTVVERKWFNGRVSYIAPVAVVTRQIEPHSRITEGDVRWEKRDVTFLSESPMTKEDLPSAIARMALTPDQIVTRSQLERDLGIRYGEEVDVIAGDENFTVTSKGQSQQNGFIGDFVKVKSATSGKILNGVLVARGVVRVQF